MKTCKYIGWARIALLGVSSLMVAKSAMAIEEAKYTVIDGRHSLLSNMESRRLRGEQGFAGKIY